ncbi:uncharacterized protein LOC117336117 [Pecten maximus]|uniref:uncharacterized protein LOC117336117 n=1 Tax=Pecten maximus TaxID=6579 RepID=UPI00145892C2|nr:uncharacterized protein LOC117336117 [Pecten maximus]
MRSRTTGMGRIALDSIAFLFTVTLWKHVMSQCSEAHAVACSWSLLHLRHYEGLLQPLGGFLPDYNETTLTEICGLFQNYMSCSEPYLHHCNNNTVFQLYELESAFKPLCKYSKEYVAHRSCYRRLETNFEWCQKERQTKLELRKPTDIQYHGYMCNVTNEYVQCIFTATFLRCSMGAANIYYDIINQSVSSLLTHVTSFRCVIRHPLEAIPVFTTTTSTTTRATTPMEATLRKTTDPALESTSRNSHHTSGSNGIIPGYLCLVVFLTIKTILIYQTRLWT